MWVFFFRQDVKTNTLYLAPFEDSYFRARVDKVDVVGHKVSVFFLDFGNHETVEIKSVIIIDDRIIQEVCFQSYYSNIEIKFFLQKTFKLVKEGAKSNRTFLSFWLHLFLVHHLHISLNFSDIFFQYPVIVETPGLAVECSLANVKPNQVLFSF